MKTPMKLLTACIAVLCLLILYSCEDGEQNRNSDTIYGYHNACSDPIVLTMKFKGGVAIKEETLLIPIGGSKEMTYRGYQFGPPFDGYNRLEISNGKVMITQGGLYDDDFLFRSISYEYTPQTNDITRFDYTFTDDFFKDGKPIAEE